MDQGLPRPEKAKWTGGRRRTYPAGLAIAALFGLLLAACADGLSTVELPPTGPLKRDFLTKEQQAAAIDDLNKRKEAARIEAEKIQTK